MSLFSTIQMAGNSLQAAEIGLQVAGQNISNANTPGYSREVVNLATGPTQQIGGIDEGTGVDIQGVSEQIDSFVNQQLLGANSEQSSTQVQSQTYQQLEQILGELANNTSGTGAGADLTTSIDNFYSSVQTVLNQPESVSDRNLAVAAGQTLARTSIR